MLPRLPIKLDFTNAATQYSANYGPVDGISQLDYIRKFISDKLHFPDEKIPRPFTYEDLDEVAPIGNGTFGRVHRMLHRDTGKHMAVKRVRIITNKADEHEASLSLKRLQIEVEAIKKASNCEQIVQFFGVTFYEGDAWVCMEVLDTSLDLVYRTVHDTLNSPYFDETVLGGVAVSTIKALDHLKNDLHIIHRDVKPSNILMDLRGRIKLCDFGISGYLVDSVAQTREAGCRPYMAPERLQVNARGYDTRSDVWSLGITMIEVATGIFPYPDFLNAPLFTQLQMVVYGDPPLLSSLEYKPLTINFVNRCLVKDEDSRPSFTQLMETEYYHNYSKMSEMKGCVADYVRMALNAHAQLT